MIKIVKLSEAKPSKYARVCAEVNLAVGENIVDLTSRMISDYSQRNAHEPRSASTEL